MTARSTEGTIAKTLVVEHRPSDDLLEQFWRWICFACTMFQCWILGDLAVVASQRVWTVWWPISRGQKKKKLCKVSICLFLSGIVNSICALFVTRCSPLYNPGRSHPAQFSFHWHNLILPQGQEAIKINRFNIMFQMLFLLYQTFVKHVKDFSKVSLHKSWKGTAF